MNAHRRWLASRDHPFVISCYIAPSHSCGRNTAPQYLIPRALAKCTERSGALKEPFFRERQGLFLWLLPGRGSGRRAARTLDVRAITTYAAMGHGSEDK